MSFIAHARKAGPVIFLDSGIYLVRGCEPVLKFDGNRLEVTNDDMTLVYPLLLQHNDSIWKIHLVRKNADIERRIDSAVMANVEEKLSAEEQAISTALGVDSKYMSVAKMMLFEVGPYFAKRQEGELGKVIVGGNKAEKEVVLDVLETKLGRTQQNHAKEIIKQYVSELTQAGNVEIEPFGKVFEKTLRAALLLSSAAGFMVCDDVTNVLTVERHTKAKLSGPVVCVGDRQYTAMPSDKDWLTSLESVFTTQANAYIKAETSRRIADRVKTLEANLDERELGIFTAALKLAKKETELSFGEWGIIFGKQNLIIYVNVPQYALRDWAHHATSYHRFPESKVAITITTNGSLSGPFLLGKGYSPFVGNGSDNTTICMGDYKTPADLPKPLLIVNLLYKAKQVLLSGYRKGANHGGRTGNLNMFPSITEEECQRQGIPITNE